MSGIEAVMGRIAEIRSTIAQFSPAYTPPVATAEATATASSATGSAPSTTFEQALAQYGIDSSSATTGPTGTDLIESASKYLGAPYVWGGESLSEGGLDCSGLVQLAMSDLGQSMPRTAREQSAVGELIASMDAAKPGDLLFFNSPATHVAIYVGNGQMLDAPKPGGEVSVRAVYETPTTIRRVLPETVSPTSAQVSGSWSDRVSTALSTSAAQRAALGLSAGATT